MAGFLADALTSHDHDDGHAHEEEDTPPPEEPDHGEDGLAALLDDGSAHPASSDALAAPNDGLPHSDDFASQPEPGVTLTGGAHDDILTGNGGDDRIVGNGGNDLLGGRTGDDWISGGAGQDWIHGGEGADTLLGGGGADELKGEDGNDLLTGGAGNDSLAGGEGSDRLLAGTGDDTLVGGDGADTLFGGGGSDALQGGQGADRVQGGRGSDEVDGNDGNDTLWGSGPDHDDHTVDFLNGGRGDDFLFLGAGDYGAGGEGADSFALTDIAPGDPLTQITDFDPAADRLLVLYDPGHHTDPEVSVLTEEGSPDATVLLDGVPVAQVMGGAGLQPSDVMLRAA